MTMWCGVAAFPSRPVVPRLCASLKVQTFGDWCGLVDTGLVGSKKHLDRIESAMSIVHTGRIGSVIIFILSTIKHAL